MDQQMEEMKFKKKERHKRITEIVQNYSLKKQEEIVKILKKDYKIEIAQSTVSRDIEELQITRDSQNFYVLGSKVRRNKEASNLSKTLRQANAERVEGELSTYLVKGKPEFLPIIASQIESLFAINNISISTFIGQNGSLLLLFPKENLKSVDKVLDQIFTHISE
ncbi:hypothetical protein [Metabacillus sp. B2-18]|uniref:hypothetical protein n=1 Tax=Metabacillus sp. B2-18 TaxID=2897333 RepID=UPI001E59D2FC|nr:hypothetical protein [Metabacillus sp. B2-18]UGB30580.1 hypothetical protein LPC09_23270 [Metabacillus sp. B2-18]